MRIARFTEPRVSDLTARARIREAAISCFAEGGFDTPFRTIAARADVSAGLITHHFGSKSELRAECDAEVLRRYRDLKSESVAAPSATLLSRLDDPGFSADLLVYLLRAVHDGGPTASTFLEHLIDEMRPVMAASVQTGLVRPSRDEEARLRYLTYQTMGALLVQFLTAPAATPEQFAASLRHGRDEMMLPMLELFTEGFLADPGPLDAYVTEVWQPRAAGEGTAGRSASPATPSTSGPSSGPSPSLLTAKD